VKAVKVDVEAVEKCMLWALASSYLTPESQRPPFGGPDSTLGSLVLHLKGTTDFPVDLTGISQP
jgi:hypothetical protein